MSKKTLGKGIEALLGEDEASDPASVAEVPLSSLRPNPQQPRHEFDDKALQELADSIGRKEFCSPYSPRPDKDGATSSSPANAACARPACRPLEDSRVVRQFSAQEKLEIALIENVQT